MSPFYPFIHKKEKKKKDNFEPLPLYIEMEQPLVPPPPKENKENTSVIIIDIF
jgi:hypothetical protein